MLKLHYFGNSYQGLTHEENQDGFLILDEAEYLICAVFDGVSRSRNPRRGVEAAMEYLRLAHYNFFRDNRIFLRDMMYETNLYVSQIGWTEPLTTYAITCLLKRNSSRFYHSNLGDSRIYSIRNREMICISKDDTLWPGSNILTRCLGMKNLSKAQFDEGQFNMENGFVLLATDGFYGILENNRDVFLRIINEKGFDSIPVAVDALIEGKNPDDATYILVQYSCLTD